MAMALTELPTEIFVSEYDVLELPWVDRNFDDDAFAESRERKDCLLTLARLFNLSDGSDHSVEVVMHRTFGFAAYDYIGKGTVGSCSIFFAPDKELRNDSGYDSASSSDSNSDGVEKNSNFIHWWNAGVRVDEQPLITKVCGFKSGLRSLDAIVQKLRVEKPVVVEYGNATYRYHYRLWKEECDERNA